MLTTAALADGYSAPRGYERPFSWSGFYIGAQGGAGWGTTEDSVTAEQLFLGGVPVTPLLAITPPGFLRDSYPINRFHGGGTIGYNLRAGPVVLGVEADVSAADISGRGDCTLSFGQLTGLRSQCHTRLNSFGTIAGRRGVDYFCTLVFVKAGGAWGEFDRDVKSGLLALGPGRVVRCPHHIAIHDGASFLAPASNTPSGVVGQPRSNTTSWTSAPRTKRSASPVPYFLPPVHSIFMPMTPSRCTW